MTHLKKGDKAPQFEAKIEDGSIISLSDYKGKKKILYFYPKDNTPGCTANACNFKDNYESLTNKGFVVIGVSIQGEKSHQKFIDKYELPFHLIVDEEKTLHETYGVWGLKKTFGKEYMGTLRTTFVIDENDVIAEVITKVKTKDATQQILDLMD
ncbi:MAG: thioredoxin-dependent thiol peroxidase [Chitinophagales bacterium]